MASIDINVKSVGETLLDGFITAGAIKIASLFLLARGGQRIQHLQPGFDHLRSDPVRADGGNPQRGQRPSPNLCTLEP